MKKDCETMKHLWNEDYIIPITYHQPNANHMIHCSKYIVEKNACGSPLLMANKNYK
jgi:hypothetical protein